MGLVKVIHELYELLSFCFYVLISKINLLGNLTSSLLRSGLLLSVLCSETVRNETRA